MYTSFFKLAKQPFGMTPDSAMVYMTETHREALAGLRYAILAKKGFALVTGDAGTGKTTLLSKLLTLLPPSVKVFPIFNPVLNASEFVEYLLLLMGIQNIPSSKAQRMMILQEYLTRTEAAGETAVLIIDEAHKLSVEVLEEVRLLGNFETANTKLLQIVLAAQTELCDLLNQTGLRQLKQRLAVRLSIQPLAVEQIGEYIGYRWQMSGATDPHPFSTGALLQIGKYARGIPRLVNAICDNALVLMVAESKPAVDEAMILSVCADLDLFNASAVTAPERVVSSAAVAEVSVAPPLATPVVIAPPAADMPITRRAITQRADTQVTPFQTLRRYEAAAKRSLLMRCAAKLGLSLL